MIVEGAELFVLSVTDQSLGYKERYWHKTSSLRLGRDPQLQVVQLWCLGFSWTQSLYFYPLHCKHQVMRCSYALFFLRSFFNRTATHLPVVGIENSSGCLGFDQVYRDAITIFESRSICHMVDLISLLR